MDLIILNDGTYQLVPLTKQMMEHMSFVVKEIDCFDLCDIIRLHLTTYHEAPFNAHIMKDGSGDLIGCICNQSFNFTCSFITVDVESRNTYPKEGKIRVGYCGEMLSLYHNFALFSNSIIRSTIKLNKHIIFINIFFSYLFHFFHRFFITKH